MKKNINYFLIVIFSFFLGSQITEAVILVPYWKSLSTSDFYSYYQNFGPSIGQFYTILTIVTAFIPIALAIYYFQSKASGLLFSIISALFAILFITCFYVYFKGTNELFYQSVLTEIELKNELITWGKWHWGRIVLEVFSLFFLILALAKRN